MFKRGLTGIKNLLVNEQNGIVSAAIMLMVISLVTKLAGMLFYSLVTREFGASVQTDMFFLASVLPETITNIILLGAISGSVIPILTKVHNEKGDEQFRRTFSSMVNIGLLGFVVLSILVAIFSREMIPFAIQLANPATKTFSDSQINQVVWMMRLMLVPQVVLGLSAFISTWLNIHHRFIIPQLAPLFFNIGKIGGVILLNKMFGFSIWNLAWGTAIGAVLHLAIQLPLLQHLQLEFNLFLIDFKDKYLKSLLQLSLPRTISLSVEQIAVITDTVIALGLTTSSLSAYTLAVRLISFPLTLFGTSYAIASYPTFARMYAQNLKTEFTELFYKVINQVIFLSLPLSVVFIVMRVPIVRLVYGIFGGNFSWNDTLQVAYVVLFFAVGVTFESLRTLMFRVFFAVHNSMIPLISGVLVFAFGVITGILFTNYFSHFNDFTLTALYWNPAFFLSKSTGQAGAAGLALSSTLVFTSEFFFLLFVLRWKNVINNLSGFFRGLFKKFLAALIMLIVCYFLSKFWEEILNTTRTVQLVILSGTTFAASIMIYLWSSYVLGIREVEIFLDFVVESTNKFLKKLHAPSKPIE